MAPLRVAQGAEGLTDQSNVLLGIVEGIELRCAADVVADPLQRSDGDHRPDIVEHQTRDRRILLAGDPHPDQPPQRRAEPVHCLDIEPGKQHQHVRHVLLDNVAGRVTQPVAAPTPDDVGAQHAIIGGQHARQIVEVTPVARQPVHANEDVRIVALTPFRIRHAMQTRRRSAAYLAFGEGRRGPGEPTG